MGSELLVVVVVDAFDRGVFDRGDSSARPARWSTGAWALLAGVRCRVSDRRGRADARAIGLSNLNRSRQIGELNAVVRHTISIL